MAKSRRMFLVLAAAALLLHAGVARAQATFHVDNTQAGASDGNDGSASSPWRTLGRCAAAMAAGDICLVAPDGVYDERVQQSQPGAAGVPVTYRAAAGIRPRVRGFTIGAGHVRVEGFEITSQGMSADNNRSIVFTGQEQVEIVDNIIHDTTREAVHAMDWSAGAPRARRCLVKGNVIANVGPPSGRLVGVQASCDGCLFEENDLSHFQDGFRVYGRENVLRNNVVHDVAEAELAGAHADAFQSFCNGSPAEDIAVHFLLLEGFSVRDMAGPDAHGFLINGTQDCGGSSTVIARYNSFCRIGSEIYYGDDNRAFGDHHKFYGNTIAAAGLVSADHIAMGFSGIERAGVFNNILFDAIVDRAPYSGYGLRPESGSQGDHNLAFLSAGQRAWGAPIGTDPHSVLNQDPLFAGLADDVLALQPGSPARDAGGPLTQVAASDSGSGTSLVVDDAHFFQPGWAGTSPDFLAVGAVDRVVEIRAIDYPTNTITLASPVSRTAGDRVWLFKDSSGRVVLHGGAPDIGAFELADCNVVGCPAQDGCHGVGTCDPQTGVCSNPRLPDGTACSGGTCQGGICTSPGGADAGADAGAGEPDAAPDVADRGPGATSSGCGCRIAGGDRGGAFLLALAWLASRRRSGAARPPTAARLPRR
ncbi:MAG: hypothetical protein JXP73_21970 [Deltaproteobacteria bacterium]|nr:hypothetical protein [Deltaproteobacteria bacterium]